MSALKKVPVPGVALSFLRPWTFHVLFVGCETVEFVPPEE